MGKKFEQLLSTIQVLSLTLKIFLHKYLPTKNIMHSLKVRKILLPPKIAYPPLPPFKKIMVRPLWVPHISMSYYDSTDKRISHDTRNNEYRSYCRYCYVICFVHIGMRAVFVSSLKNKTKQLCHSE